MWARRMLTPLGAADLVDRMGKLSRIPNLTMPAVNIVVNTANRLTIPLSSCFFCSAARFKDQEPSLLLRLSTAVGSDALNFATFIFPWFKLPHSQ